MRLWDNKKGVGVKYLVGIAVVLIGFMATLGIYAQAGDAKLPEGAKCKATLIADAKADMLPQQLDNFITSNCETIVYEDLEDMKTDTRIKEGIADKMAHTWWIISEGSNRNLWGDEQLGFGALGHSCVIMYEIPYEDPKYTKPIETTWLREYIINETYEPKNITYDQYIQSYNGDGFWSITAEPIEPGNTYAIAVFSPKSYEDLNFREKILWLGGIYVKDRPNTQLSFMKLEDAENWGCHYLISKKERGKANV